ncbi:hypothetical protein SORBI_3005G058600 [Sorghum bicolor]|uniref:DUF6598 domain-containing protein n=1 Tax=Sorghum bicolor TaxID=4558 RepID=C5Y623_SORBI|nr:hypothetical protein SORBI_3005G058600 [Sorghum bicolor]
MEMDAPSCRPTPSSKEDRMSLLVAKVKAEWDERVARYAADKAAREKEGLPEEDSGEEDDYYAVEAREFRNTWNFHYSRYSGCFEDTTTIPNMRFTYKKPEPRHIATPRTTLQIFSLKVSKIREGLQWPLQVFGMVAIRDCVDHNRNIIFDRPRDNCQILTREVPNLKLTGPTRAVVLLDPATFEVDLKVKGTTEPEDKCLSFLAVTYINFTRLHSHRLTRDFTSRLSTVEFELGSMVSSVEATIALRIINGSWPDGYRAQFTAGTTSISSAEIILLDSGDDKVPVVGYGRSITLSRCVASVEEIGELKVCAKALRGDKVLVGRKIIFKPKKESASDGTLHLGFCTLGVTISWSLISSSV